MSLDQKRARWFGVLYLITFVTSIPALALYETVLRHPVSYIAGGGHDKQVLFGAFLELLLIIANIGTAVVIFPIVRRQNEELALGYVTARVFECAFILVGIVAMIAIITLPSRARLGRRLRERDDPRLPDVPIRARAAPLVLARARGRAV